jgi:hypothetical protein
MDSVCMAHACLQNEATMKEVKEAHDDINDSAS